jgi:hypothetical protein
VAGWMPKAEVKTLATTNAQFRLHLNGAIDLQTMDIFTREYDTINGASIISFFTELEEYYYASKYKYIDMNKINHNKFNTVIRQICKNTNTHFFKTLRHDQSKYSVVYYIDFSNSNIINIDASVNANDNTNVPQ